MRSKTIVTTALVLSLVFSGNMAYGAAKDSGKLGALERSWAKEKNELIKQLRERRQRHNHDGKESKSMLPILKETASLLGMSKEDLVKELQQGKSLSDVAQARGMSESDLIGKLIALRNQKVNEAVIAGKMSAEKAEKIKAYMKEHLSYMVKQKGMQSLHKDRMKSMRHRTLKHFNPERVAAIIGISEEELSAQLKKGKSLVEIAEANGMSKEQLMSKLKEESQKLSSPAP
ncbi:hypothetical protein [Paenibacillus sp. J2TS4]|uniref:hypothetical protein n=1 Tax=Paenibacillus sp. J2TS4 TaxID=2807194 RepID=UPI001AFFE50A|nr:hypothetical protein [Paenibacillus sp. J2TS4]GIP32864.1 hypothetical protein J2TS4_20740 [Paenibacillus sp. J2TS4]